MDESTNERGPEVGDHVEARYWDTGSGDGWIPAIITRTSTLPDGTAIVAASGRRPDGSICGPHVTGFWGDRIRPVAP